MFVFICVLFMFVFICVLFMFICLILVPLYIIRLGSVNLIDGAHTMLVCAKIQ